MIEIRNLGLDGVLEVRPQRLEDARGWFSQTYNTNEYARAGIGPFVQDNQSFSAVRGVLRGLHYQLPPFAQAKLVRVVKGSVFDVAVDIRRSSPAFGRWVGVRLSAGEGNQIFIPAGFAHGFVALEDQTEVLYKVSAEYSLQHERSICFSDPDIGIDWPLPPEEVRISDKDRSAPGLREAAAFD